MRMTESVSTTSARLITMPTARLNQPALLVGSLLLAVACVTGCSPSQREPDSAGGGKLKVFVSIPPQAGLVRKIGGEQVEAEVLVRPGQSPHTFEPTPRQIGALSEATIYFTLGLPFENMVAGKIRNQHTPLLIVDTSQGIQRRLTAACCEHDHAEHDHAAPDHEHDHEQHERAEQEHVDHHHGHGHDHTGHSHGHPEDEDHAHEHREIADPHVWMSPLLLERIVANMIEAMAKADPPHAAEYRQRGEQLIAEIDALHQKIADSLKPYHGRAFYVFHPAFGYFAETYGLEQVAVEIGGKSPTPKQLGELIERAKADRVKVIFVQEQFDKRSAELVAEAIGGVVVAIDPLSEDLFSTLERLAEEIDAALSEPESRQN